MILEFAKRRYPSSTETAQKLLALEMEKSLEANALELVLRTRARASKPVASDAFVPTYTLGQNHRASHDD
jgi:hypothetical protein